MSTFHLINSEVRNLTPELAKEFRELTPSPTERDLDPKRVQYLKEKALAGNLVTFGWSVAKLGNQRMRMNGQHSSNMLCELDGAFPTGLKVHLDEYEVTDRNGLALLFRQFDDRKSGRTPTDVSGAYQMLVEPIKDVPRLVAKLAVEGINWYRRHVAGTPFQGGDDVYQLFNETELHEFIRWLGDVFSIKTPELKHPAIVGAMYATFAENPTEAKLFWEQVSRGGVEYDDNAPSTVLDGWLKEAKEEKNAQRKVKPGEYFQGCVYGWNGYREGKSLKDIKADVRKGFHKIAA